MAGRARVDGCFRRRDGTLLPAGQKECSECGRVLALENFHRNGTTKDGQDKYHGACRACSARSRRERYWSQHEAELAKNRSYRRQCCDALRVKARARNKRMWAGLSEGQRARLVRRRRAQERRRDAEKNRAFAPVICEMVCAHYGVVLAELTDTGRREETVWPLHMLIWQLHTRLRTLSLGQISALVGRDHSTVLHAIQAMPKRKRRAKGVTLRWDNALLAEAIIARRKEWEEEWRRQPGRGRRSDRARLVPQPPKRQEELLKAYERISKRQRDWGRRLAM